MNKPKGLGRGLDALLGSSDEAPRGDTLGSLPVGRIRPGKYQPRTRMGQKALAELASSIKAQGLMQPVIVRPVERDRYELIAGERRWRAAGGDGEPHRVARLFREGSRGDGVEHEHGLEGRWHRPASRP